MYNKRLSILFLSICFFACKQKFVNEYFADGSIKKEFSKEKYTNGDSLLVLKYFTENKLAVSSYYHIEKFYSNGTLQSKGAILDGEKDGKWEEWYENGQKGVSETYSYGNRIGKYKSWFSNGKILEEY